MNRFPNHRGDVACNNLHCGDHVREKDGRFTGVLLSIQSGTGKVQWDDTGWISWVFTHDLERVH